MLGKPIKVMNHGNIRWQPDTRDPITRKRVRKFFKTRQEALDYQKLIDQTPTYDLRPDLDALTPFATYAERLMAEKKRRPKTAASYAWALAHANPFIVNPGTGLTFGAMPVAQLRRGYIKSLI